MFFDLVTADVVVADLSIPNPNVYYELGIRDGVSPRGVFIIQGGWTANRPFDVASDRSFSYRGKLFAVTEAPVATHDVAAAVAKLSRDLRLALSADTQTTGSPLYAHLPGLKQVDCENIETSKARYFGALSLNWLDMVRRAQDLHRPGNIITLAHDAPTRLHRTRILSLAARSLIGLCQLKAAEKVLTDILRLNPDDLEVQHQLGAVLASQGEVELAQTHMSHILEQQKDSEPGMTLGMIYRVSWYLQWTNDSNPRQRATDDSELLMLAIESFYRAHRSHPEQYLNAYNALLLIAIAQDLGVKPSRSLMDIDELTTVVRYIATLTRETATNSDALFWSAVCLSGLAMIKDDQVAASQWMNNALPSATLFDLQMMKERLGFLEKLQFRPSIVSVVQKVIEERLAKRPQNSWRKVVVFSGYPLGESSRFPVSAAPAVAQKIQDILKNTWELGPGDLALCAGSTAGDVMFAECCHSLGAKVRLLMVDQDTDQVVEAFVDRVAGPWASRGYELANTPGVDVWRHCDELGEPGESASILARNNRWILNTAVVEADATPNTRLMPWFFGTERCAETTPKTPLSSSRR